ncbi:ferrous iron transporter B [Patescibacteria group bacterium]|nr:ferrous iron transporter B [Patescibacteria group bacterium]
MKILLIGNQNVGKSSIFYRLTGVHVVISNYPGSTVEYKEGTAKIGNKEAQIVDVPGMYSLEATSKAENVAIEMLNLNHSDLIINVVDATNLERNLNLTLQLLEKNVPVIVALNFGDEALHKGIVIDLKKLSEILAVPVISTVAATGEGIKDLVNNIPKAKAHRLQYSESERWAKVGKIIKQVQTITGKKHSFFEKIQDLSIKPLTGIPIAFLVMLSTFSLVRFIGESLIAYVFEPFFNLLLPLYTKISAALSDQHLIHDIIIGKLVNGEIDFVQSMGLLTTGLFVPFAMVLPYVFAFYLALGILEDSGYLPRLATLVDNLMHKIGMHGLAIVPMLLGLGCNVPAAMSTRILESKRQRFIAGTVMAIAVPCSAQLAMIFGLIGSDIKAMTIFFSTLFIVAVGLGFILNKIMKGKTPETFLEIPPYRLPRLKNLAKKMSMKIRGFLTEAVPYVLLGVLFVNILFVTGAVEFIGNIFAPVIVNILGLPKEAVASLIVGFLRKDVAVGMLLPLDLSIKQLIVAGVVLTMYFPCIATFMVLFKELGIRLMFLSILIMISSTLIVGGILNLIL